MKKRSTLIVVTVLLGIVCVVLCALRLSEPAPLLLETPAEEASPSSDGVDSLIVVPEATEHLHQFAPETGICSFCGAVCDHSTGFDAEHRCLSCRWQCLNQIHDPETALCPVCGEAFHHHFGMDGVCDVCGAEAPLCSAELPDRFFEPCRNEGRHFRETLTDADGYQYEIAVWLPWV